MTLHDVLKPKSEEEIQKSIDKMFLTLNIYTLCNILINRHCNFYKFKYIIKHPLFDPNFQDGYLFHTMCLHGNLTKVDLLLQNEKLDPSLVNNRSIKIAYLMNFKEIVDMLLKNKKVTKKLTRKEIKNFRSLKVVTSHE